MTNLIAGKWATRYLSLAKEVSTWSKDPSTQIGAVAIGSDGQQLSQGYNGFPRGIEDHEERLTNRELKYRYTVHGEMNCIFNACLNGVSLKDSVLFVYGLPICSNCTNGAIQVGVKQIIMAHPESISELWIDEWVESRSKLIETAKSYTRYEFGESGFDSLRVVECVYKLDGGRARYLCGPESQWETIEYPYHLRALK